AHARPRRRHGPARERRHRPHQLRRRHRRLPDLGRVRRVQGRPRSSLAHVGRGAARHRRAGRQRRPGRHGHGDARRRAARRRSRDARQAGRRRRGHRADPRRRRPVRLAGEGALVKAMRAAGEPRLGHEQRMLVVDAASGELSDERVTSLAIHVRPGDVWVLNDSAPLPASLAGRIGDTDVELRLSGELSSGRWRAVLFGRGSWRDDTDRRHPPPRVSPGDTIALGGSLRAHVERVDPRSARLLEISFTPRGDAFWRALYAVGQPVQYSYLLRELELRELSTAFAGRPWSVELPSAGRPLTLERLRDLRRAGAAVVALTHAAGLSATGDPALDALLPLPERYD